MPTQINESLAELSGKANVTFKFPPGDFDLRGITVGRGWNLSGAGIGITRIRLMPGNGACLFNMEADARNVTFRDFTLDCNWPAFGGERGTVGIGGFVDDGLLIKRVEITGHGAIEPDAGGAIYATNILRIARRVTVRDCWIHDGHGHAHAVALASNNHHTAADGNLESTVLTALVENNLLHGPGSIAVGIQGSGGRIIGNRIEGFTYGFFGDTGFQYDQLFADNQISGTHWAAYFAGGYFDPIRQQPGFYRNTLRGNTITVTPTGSGIYLGQNCGENIVEGNVIRAEPGIPNRPGIVFASEFPNVARGNQVDASLLTQT